MRTSPILLAALACLPALLRAEGEESPAGSGPAIADSATILLYTPISHMEQG